MDGDSLRDSSGDARILENLNPRQRAAVTLADGSALVLAGAGTGKTRVLTTRIAWLIQNRHASPNQILAVTFTNKAAREMRERVAAMTPFGTGELWLGTFHGLCNRLLRQHADAAGIDRDFQIMDSQDQLQFVKRLLRENDIDAELFPPADIRNFISREKESGRRPPDSAALADSSRVRQMAHIFSLYEKARQNESRADFAELLLRAYELLRDKNDLRMHYAARFRHVLIDEFQDTSRLQYEWLKLLRGENSRFFAVGDDDQSIYAFRGAEPENMAAYRRDFNIGENKTIRLEQNYRSTAVILKAANHLIANNSNRLGKNLFTSNGDGMPLSLFVATDDSAEAMFVVGEIARLRSVQKNPDAAVLYRTNAQSRLFEREFVRAGIPYRIYGGQRFFERKEIKDVLAYLRLIAVPQDSQAFLRAVNFPPRGIGDRKLEEIQAAAERQNTSLFEAARKIDHIVVGGFISLMDSLAEMRSKMSLADLTKEIIARAKFREYYESPRRKEYERAENLSELVNAVAEFDSAQADGEFGGEDPLQRFLTNATLESGEAQNGGNSSSEAAANLMTMHAAKGLEFDSVFAVGMEDGLFPGDQSIFSGTAAIEEERRLAYVAFTRAKKNLTLCRAESRMQYGKFDNARLPSRFLDEIPAELIRLIDSPFSAKPVFSPPPPPIKRTVFASPMPPSANGEFRPGEQVVHQIFGVGIIIKIRGEGKSANADIFFKEVGEMKVGEMKTLMLSHAKLEKI